MTPPVHSALTGPVVGSTAVGALLLVAVAYTAVGPLISVVHEGGHMVVGLLTGLRVTQFTIRDVGDAETGFERLPWGPGRILMTIAGYTMPPLVGLGGAALLAAEKVRPALWIALLLLILAWAKAERSGRRAWCCCWQPRSATWLSAGHRCSRPLSPPAWSSCC
jgi:hypothetical protein